MTAIIVEAGRVQPVADFREVRNRVAADVFFWLDLVGEADDAHSSFLAELGLGGADMTWALRFGQAARMNIGLQRLRAVTWIADREGGRIEVHLLALAKGLVTIWRGDPATLDAIRLQFADRIGAIERNFYEAAGILLQLLLGTLDFSLQRLDARIDELRLILNVNSSAKDFAATTTSLQNLQISAGAFSRYASAVRSATVGVETLPGAGARGAVELNDYADQVEDFEEQLFERRQWMSDITHDFATAVAQRQGEQINRLTLVSLIFLPVTAFTGFFGMNFDWMTRAIVTPQAFFAFGVALPVLSVALNIVWLSRAGLIRLDFRRRISSISSVDPGANESPSVARASASDLTVTATTRGATH